MQAPISCRSRGHSDGDTIKLFILPAPSLQPWPQHSLPNPSTSRRGGSHLHLPALLPSGKIWWSGVSGICLLERLLQPLGQGQGYGHRASLLGEVEGTLP